ncbi:hypothetical protein NYP18_07075 [Corynebacterium sp. YIM 101645]|uniref:DAGKc domain-containing protein n=1 Tax=Corynebacterium lemuris TaxID=1859292 RepID=A0ABT2FVZ1_9CORY|nr:diacylglycerol kinase family protein [Corynebacterium lemuris]MCS5479417.1 hypothetical protein [Corynebacterium lemuris]
MSPHDTGRSPRVAVIHNPTKIAVSDLEHLVTTAATRHGWQTPLLLETSGNDPGFGPAQQAVADGHTLVLAAGGDGTVRAVAAALRGTGTALGILPLGTGNLLARNLRLPLDLPTAIDTAFTGHDRPIDVCTALLTRPDGESEELDFLVMAGIGIDAGMIINTDDDLKKRARVLAYIVGIAKSLAGGRRVRLTWRLDGGRARRTRVHSLIVGNCGELVGRIPLLPEAAADDGHFDVVSLRPRGLPGWLQIAGELARHSLRRLARRAGPGTPTDSELLRYATGTRLEVRLDRPEVFEVDGDVVGEVSAFTVTIEPGCLVVREAGSGTV